MSNNELLDALRRESLTYTLLTITGVSFEKLLTRTIVTVNTFYKQRVSVTFIRLFLDSSFVRFTSKRLTGLFFWPLNQFVSPNPRCRLPLGLLKVVMVFFSSSLPPSSHSVSSSSVLVSSWISLAARLDSAAAHMSWNSSLRDRNSLSNAPSTLPSNLFISIY